MRQIEAPQQIRKSLKHTAYSECQEKLDFTNQRINKFSIKLFPNLGTCGYFI